MTQAERDRLITLKKAQRGMLTQSEAATELGVTDRQVRRMLVRLKKSGDKSVLHGLAGRKSNRQLDEGIRRRAVEILSDKKCHDFGPTYARDHLAKKKINVSKETVRKWMSEAKLWRAGRKKPEKKVHVWRERRSRFGELVQWDTSDHDWLEGRGSERLYLIAMIDDATSRLWARFVRHDSTEENMNVLEAYLKRNGSPLAFYTDKASLFQTARKVSRDQRELPREDREPLPPTQVERALKELGIIWIAAHSAQAKGRVERSFETAQDRLVKDLRMAGVTTLEQANEYLDAEFLPWWNRTLVVEPRDPQDSHRPLEKGHDLAAILSHVESRIIKTDYTFQFEGTRYVIEQADIRNGLRNAAARIEKRRDGSLAVRFEQQYLRYLRYRPCVQAQPVERKTGQTKPVQATKKRAGKSGWMGSFDLQKAPSLNKAIAISNATS